VIFVRITNNKALAVGRKRCMVQVHTATIKQRYIVGAMRQYYRNLFMATTTLNIEMIQILVTCSQDYIIIKT